jgi:hypothetical protein
MAFLSIDDADFWGRNTPEMEKIYEAGYGEENLTTSFFLLGKRENNPVGVAVLRMGPDFVLQRHAHDCNRFEILVQGSLSVGDRVLKVGSVMITEPGELYGPHIAGPEGCTTFEILSDYEGGSRLMLEEESGKLFTLNLLDPALVETIVAETKKRQDEARRA